MTLSFLRHRDIIKLEFVAKTQFLKKHVYLKYIFSSYSSTMIVVHQVSLSFCFQCDFLLLKVVNFSQYLFTLRSHPKKLCL